LRPAFEDGLPIFCEAEIGDKPWGNEGLSSSLLQQAGRLQLKFQLADICHSGIGSVEGR